MERPKPYVGVSGVVSQEQQKDLRHLALSFSDKGRRLALGVKAVHKTQWLNIENKYGAAWYPVGEAIGSAVTSGYDEDELRVAQVYMDTEAAQASGIEEYETQFVNKLLGRTAGWLSGVQFDMLSWTAKDYRKLLTSIKEQRPSVEILLQCHGDIMSTMGPVAAMAALDRYEGLIDHVLFDASHGTGKEMSPEALRPFIEEAAQREWLGVGVAGGLDAQRVARHIPELLEVFPGLSFDAEGRLHKTGEAMDRGLDMQVTRHYLQVATDVLVTTR